MHIGKTLFNVQHLGLTYSFESFVFIAHLHLCWSRETTCWTTCFFELFLARSRTLSLSFSHPLRTDRKHIPRETEIKSKWVWVSDEQNKVLFLFNYANWLPIYLIRSMLHLFSDRIIRDENFVQFMPKLWTAMWTRIENLRHFNVIRALIQWALWPAYFPSLPKWHCSSFHSMNYL